MNLQTAVRKPRRRPAPSERDQQIYIDYQATGRLQTDLAEQYKLTQCRISQIIRRVERWLSGADIPVCQPRNVPTLDLGPETFDSAAAQRQLALRLERERLNLVARESMRHFRQEQKTVTHKKGTRGDTPYEETTERIQPPSIQGLKVILQANRQLNQLEKVGWDKLAQASAGPPSSTPNDDDFREQVIQWLGDGRERANRAGLVASALCNHTLIRELVKYVLGEPNTGVALHVLARDIGKIVVNEGHEAPAKPNPRQREDEAPAEPTTNSSTSAASDDSPQTEPSSDLPIETPQSKSQNTPRPPSWNPLCGITNFAPNEADDPHTRRIKHYERLRLLREAQATGLPCMFHFDSADGPLPPAPPYIVDGAPP